MLICKEVPVRPLKRINNTPHPYGQGAQNGPGCSYMVMSACRPRFKRKFTGFPYKEKAYTFIYISAGFERTRLCKYRHFFSTLKWGIAIPEQISKAKIELLVHKPFIQFHPDDLN